MGFLGRRSSTRALAATAMAPIIASAQPVSSASRDPLDRLIYTFTPADASQLTATTLAFTLRDALEGVAVFGSTGSGKTSGSGKHIAQALLRAGFGGLVLTTKPSDVDDWRDRYFDFPAQTRPAQRRDWDKDVIVIDGSDIDVFNFLDYEHQDYRRRKDSKGKDLAGLTQNLVSLLLNAMTQTSNISGEAYWEEALRQLLMNSIDTVTLAQASGLQSVSLRDVMRVVQEAPTSPAQARSSQWQRSSACWSFLEQLEKRACLNPRIREDAEQCRDYWLYDFAGLSDRSRGSIVSMMTAKLTPLLRTPLRQLLCGKTNVPIPDLTRQGKVVILNLPVKVFGEVGQFAQVLIKTVWQRCIERSPDNARPVFLWADEAQYFLTKEDALFQQTARSAGCATVYLTQTINNYYSVMDANRAESMTDAFLANLSTKIFHANADPITNEWAERLFARDIMELRSTSYGSSFGHSASQHMEFRVPAKEFIGIKRGGTRRSDGTLEDVQAILFRAGHEVVSSDELRRFMPPLVSFRQA